MSETSWRPSVAAGSACVSYQGVLGPLEDVLRDQHRCREDRPEVELGARLLIRLAADMIIIRLAIFRPYQQIRVGPAAGLRPLADISDRVGAAAAQNEKFRIENGEFAIIRDEVCLKNRPESKSKRTVKSP